MSSLHWPLTLTEHSEITVVTVAPMGLLISERCHSETLEQNTGLWWEKGFHLPPGAGGPLREELMWLGPLML